MPDKSVAFILDYSARTWSGVDDYYLQICKRLRARQVRSLIAYSEQPPEQTRSRFEGAGATSIALPYTRDYSFYRKLREALHRHQVQLVDICFFDYFSAVPWIAWLAGAKHVVYTEANSGKVNAHSWQMSLLRLRTRFMSLPVRRVVAMSEYIRERSVCVGMRSEKVSVIYQGVDMSRYLPDSEAQGRLRQKYEFQPHEVIIVCMNRLVPFKHCEIAIEAISLLIKSKIPVQLLVAGDGPLRTELEELARKRKVEHCVHFLGHFCEPELLLQGCDLFLLTSVGEAFGYVLAEAMACGCPVVGSNSGSIPELVEHRETGLLATPLDPQSFAEALETLAADPELRTAMGRRAIQRAREKFNLELTVDRTLRLYAELWDELRI
jgi:glycosyltransferase involved in cell wall biosynthesis